ncbi:DUF3602 domain protein [Metarhizium robertsii]|uniref:DUF3602 domain protein n=1 Tax=Metarhizium robertsii TaxID=568076 RepID=A0A014N4I2_9HYPO|nr:DUF3602 domain protein [Metarhizium robertsii]
MAQKNEASRSPVTPQLSSHGRGGAGNMVDSSQSSKLHPSDLETPVLKNPVVTTGRGGTGNMAKNADPRETRRRQDVGAVDRFGLHMSSFARVPRRYSSGAQHSGRGGAGNVFRENEDSGELGRKISRDQAVTDDAPSRDAVPSPDPDATSNKRFVCHVALPFEMAPLLCSVTRKFFLSDAIPQDGIVLRFCFCLKTYETMSAERGFAVCMTRADAKRIGIYHRGWVMPDLAKEDESNM